MANYRPLGAGAGEPPSEVAAPAPAAKIYRAPTKQELNDIIRLFHLHEDGYDSLTASDADSILAWLKERPDLSVDWFYDERRYGQMKKLGALKYEFNSAYNSILAMVFQAEHIHVNHPLIDELACRNPDFTIEDEDGESLLHIMADAIEYWNSIEIKKERDINYRAKYEIAKNPEKLKDLCNRKYIRSGVKNVASLLRASKSGLPVPEGPLSVITGMLTGKKGSVKQQMASAKKNLYFPSAAASSSSSSSSAAASSSSSSSSSAAPPPAPPPAPATMRRRRRRRWYGGPKKGGRMTRRRVLRK
jgi:hypothetical protein